MVTFERSISQAVTAQDKRLDRITRILVASGSPAPTREQLFEWAYQWSIDNKSGIPRVIVEMPEFSHLANLVMSNSVAKYGKTFVGDGMTCAGRPKFANFDDRTHQEFRDVVLATMEYLQMEQDCLSQETTYVPTEVLELIKATAEVMPPEMLHPDDLIAPSGTVIFETPLFTNDFHPYFGTWEETIEFYVRGFCWYTLGDTVVFFPLTDTENYQKVYYPSLEKQQAVVIGIETTTIPPDEEAMGLARAIVGIAQRHPGKTQLNFKFVCDGKIHELVPAKEHEDGAMRTAELDPATKGAMTGVDVDSFRREMEESGYLDLVHSFGEIKPTELDELLLVNKDPIYPLPMDIHTFKFNTQWGEADAHVRGDQLEGEPDVMNLPPHLASYRKLLIATMRMFWQKILEREPAESTDFTRGLRRSSERAKSKVGGKVGVNIVRLSRAHSGKSGTGLGTKLAYKTWVKGFWRFHYYSSLGPVDSPYSHKWIWIKGHARGPGDGEPVRNKKVTSL